MPSSESIQIRLGELMARMKEPENYYKGVEGASPDLPDNILFLHRWPHLKISDKVKGGTLFHCRNVLTVNMKTDGLVCINDKAIALPEGYAILTSPYQAHCYVVDQNTFDWLVITFDAPAHIPLPTYRSARLSPLLLSLLERLLSLYLRHLNGTAPKETPKLLQGYLFCLLMELGAEPECLTAEEDIPSSMDLRLHLFERINGYIHKHLANPGLSLREIAAAHSISLASLHNLFHEKLGLTPGRYIRKCRIKQAGRLLARKDMLISEVAEKTGFSSPAVFSRCFHNETGTTASSFSGDIPEKPS